MTWHIASIHQLVAAINGGFQRRWLLSSLTYAQNQLFLKKSSSSQLIYSFSYSPNAKDPHLSVTLYWGHLSCSSDFPLPLFPCFAPLLTFLQTQPPNLSLNYLIMPLPFLFALLEYSSPTPFSFSQMSPIWYMWDHRSPEELVPSVLFYAYSDDIPDCLVPSC